MFRAGSDLQSHSCVCFLFYIDYDNRLQKSGNNRSAGRLFRAGRGTQAGDVITEINGRNVHIWDDVSLYTMTHADEAPFKVEYERDGKKYTAKLEPRQLEGDAAPLLGVTSGDIIKPGILNLLNTVFTK